MPDFGSPFGIGYGLGAAGAGAAQGLVQGQIMAPRLAYERLQNQALQSQIQSTQATKQALSAEAPRPSGQQDLTPYDKPVRDMEAQIKALRAAGQGDQVERLMPDYIKFSQAQHMAQLGKGAQMLLGPNPKAAIPLIKAAGLGDVTDVNVDPQTGQYVFTNADGSTSQMTKQDIANVAADPSHLSQYLAMQNLYGARVQHYGALDESRRVQDEIKARAQQWKEETFPDLMQTRREVAQIGAGGRVQAAATTQAGANYRFMNQPDHQMIQELTDNGLSYQDAYAATQAIKARKASAELMATSLLKGAMATRPGDFQDQASQSKYLQDMTSLIKGLQGGPKPPPPPPGKGGAGAGALKDPGKDGTLANAQAAIKRGIPKADVVKKMKANGYDTSGLE